MKLSFNFKKIFSKKHSSAKGGGIKPDRDWQIRLVAFLIGLLFIVVIAGFNLWRINQGDFFDGADQTGGTSAPLDQELLDRVLTKFDQKGERLEQYKTNPPETFDPSL